MRLLSFLVASLVCACASAPPPVPRPATDVADAKPEPPAPEPPAPLEPLAMENVELSIDSGFLAFGLSSLTPKLWTDDELSERLPAGAKRELDAVSRADKAVREARRKESRAAVEFYDCEGCRERARLERQLETARRTTEKARGARRKAFDRAEKSLERQLTAATAKPEVGIALARLQARELSPVGAQVSHPVRYGQAGSRASGIAALERAAELAPADREVGQHVRRELLNGLWDRQDAELARRVIAELEPVAPAAWRAELHYRGALFDALEGNDAKAAEGFEHALAAHVPGSAVSRKTLASAALIARYRSLDFERALAAAARVVEEAARPEPPAPAPPPKPKPNSKTKPAKAGDPRVAKAAALRQAAEFGMLGLLSTSSFGSRELDETGVARLAADCVERLGRDPMKLSGPAEARAGILSVLATRALYRNDLDRARQLAEASRGLGSLAETRAALQVLQALALRENEPERAGQLAKEESSLPRAHLGSWVRADDEPDTRELVEHLRKARGGPDVGAKDNAKADEPAVARNVRSVLRVCLEPLRTRLPEATGSGKARRIATLTLTARVFPDGRVELETSSDRADAKLDDVVACARAIGPRALARAPSSVSARVTLSESVRRSDPNGLGSVFADDVGLGGLTGSSLGDLQGIGGLGLRGSGGGGRKPPSQPKAPK